MTSFQGPSLSNSISKSSIFSNNIFSENLFPTTISSSTLVLPSRDSPQRKQKPKTNSLNFKANSTFHTRTEASNLTTSQVEEEVEVEVAEGYTISQFSDKIIDVFLNEKPKSKEWRKYLVFREEWNKYRESFYNRCRRRADMETDPILKEKLISLGRKVKK
ncbi:hypothetical protein TIFTF001_052139, partial [Ficus carica]